MLGIYPANCRLVSSLACWPTLTYVHTLIHDSLNENLSMLLAGVLEMPFLGSTGERGGRRLTMLL